MRPRQMTAIKDLRLKNNQKGGASSMNPQHYKKEDFLDSKEEQQGRDSAVSQAVLNR